MNKYIYSVRTGVKSERLDTYLSSKSGLSRAHIQRLARQGMVTVNSRAEKISYRIKRGDKIEFTVPENPELILTPEKIPLEIVWEDENIIVINKPPGMVMYPAAGNKSGTLLNALVSKCSSLASAGAPLRPGVVHRLDKDTSGLIIFAKNDPSYLNLIKQFSERQVEKHYLALLSGRLKKNKGEIKIAIGRSASDRKKMSTKTKKGKEAITYYEVIKEFKHAVLAKVRIVTGRTHQIRVHFTAFGHPVLGDRTYGKKITLKTGSKTIMFRRQMLHAYSLNFLHPATGKLMELTAPVPDDMEKAIEELSD